MGDRCVGSGCGKLMGGMVPRFLGLWVRSVMGERGGGDGDSCAAEWEWADWGGFFFSCHDGRGEGWWMDGVLRFCGEVVGRAEGAAAYKVEC